MSTAATGPSGKGKAGLSCAECRRSKLKCDRTFPCQSCIRRGCAAICPDGTLAATKGNKVLMAHAQKLAEQVKSMSARIRELEAALEKSQGDSPPHPLLATRDAGMQDPLGDIRDLEAKYEEDLVDNVSEDVGSLAIGQDGSVKYYGGTAGAEYLQGLMPEGEMWMPSKTRDAKHLGLPLEIMELVNSFPFGLDAHYYTAMQFINYIPPRERAIQLVNLYYANAAWMYDPIPRGDFERIVLEPIYTPASGIISLNSIHPHILSVLLMILAIGAVYESDASHELLADQYHALARAAFALESIVRGATCGSVQALFLMIHFVYLSNRSGNEQRWLLSGLCAKVAQMIGLQRDSAGWMLEKDEIQRRRTMFWEFYTWDAWSSVVNGRPPALNLGHSDCRFPGDLDPSFKEGGTSELGYHAWKFRYSAACLSISVQRAFTVRPLNYKSLLDLDQRIRTFPVPKHLQSPAQDATKVWDLDPARAMQQYCVICESESNLLYIHRSYFAEAIRESPDPLQHKYGPSVLAAYRSAMVLISSMKGLNAVHPKLAGRVWFFWSGFYTSCILLSALVIESPGSRFAQSALAELDSARVLYEDGSRMCRPPSTMTMLNKLHTRAHTAFGEYQLKLSSGELAQPNHTENNPHNPDELHVLGGRKSIITKSTSSSPHTGPAPSPADSGHSASPEAESHSSSSMPRSYMRTATMSESHQQPLSISPPIASHPSLTMPSTDPGRSAVDPSITFGAYFDAAIARAEPGRDFRDGSFIQARQSEVARNSLQAMYQAMQTAEAERPSNTFVGDDDDAVFDAMPGIDLEPFGLQPPVPQQAQQAQQQYNFYPPMPQHADIGMINSSTVIPPGHLNQDEIWWKFVQDLGVGRT